MISTFVLIKYFALADFADHADSIKPSLIFVIQSVIRLQLNVILRIFQNDKSCAETQKHFIIEFSLEI